MAQIGTRSQAPGAKSIPAELRAAPWQGTPDFALARLHENAAQVQARGGVIPPGLRRHGISGLGDTCYDAWGSPYGCDANGIPTSNTPTVIPAGDSNFDWGGLVNVINAGSTDIAKILAASNPGTMYRDPAGNVIYSQPTGNTQNLPVGAGGPSGTINTPLGSGSFSGISSSTILLIAVAGMMFMMMGSRR